MSQRSATLGARASSVGERVLPRAAARLVTCLLLSIITLTSARANEPASSVKRPEIKMCLPLGVPATALGKEPLSVTARGTHLANITNVQCVTPGIQVKFIKQAAAKVPAGLSSEKVGDQQIDLELTISEDWRSSPPAQIELTFVADPKDEARAEDGSASYTFPIGQVAACVLEQENNAGFAQPQSIAVPQIVLGQIERAGDVDVFAMDLQADTTMHFGVQARRYGSGLDSLLSLVDSNGAVLAVSDDMEQSRDPHLEFSVPLAGRYFLVVQDANDLGGEAHPYRLTVERAPTPVSFVREIAPLLVRHCVACHGARKSEGGYRADSYANAVAPGDSGAHGFVPHAIEDSESLRRIESQDEAERMPLRGQPLSASQIALIQRWIDEGAAFDGHDPAAMLVTQIPPVEHPAAPETYPAPWPVTALCFSRDGGQLVVSGYRELLVVDTLNQRLLDRIGNFPERIYRIARHPNQDQLAVACGDPGQWGEVRLLDEHGALQRVLAVASDVIHDVQFSPDGAQVAVADCEGRITIYDPETGAQTRQFASHLDWVLAVAWSPDGSKLGSASRDKTAKVHDVASGRLLASYARHDAPVRGIVFHPAGEEVYTAGENQRWEHWRVSGAERVREMGLGGAAYGISAADDVFAIPSSNHRVHVMKLHDGQRVHELQGEASDVFLSAALHPATDRVAAGTQEGQLVIWEIQSGKRISRTPCLLHGATAARPDDQPAASTQQHD